MSVNGRSIKQLLVIALVGLCAVSASAITITVNPATEYQSIDGFGGFGCIKEVKVRVGPFYVDAPMPPHYDTLAYDLGVTLNRYQLAPSYQTSEGGPYDFDGGVFCGPISKQAEHVRQFRDRGVTQNLWTVWSPPGWMKVSGVPEGGMENAPDYNTTTDKLKPEHWDEFAHYCVAYLRAMRDSTGVEPYAISLQNEPRFQEPYNSCVYNKTAYRDMHKVAAPIIRAAFPNIKFIGSEDVFGWHFNDWIPTVFGDATAGPYFYAAAGHYGDAGEYTQAHGGASNYGKVIWGSEETHNSGGSSLSGAIGQAERLHWAVVNGHATGWIIWVMNSMFDDQRHPLWTYFGAKHFWRFVRPGAKRIAATGGSSSFLVCAFKHTGDNTTTVIVINKSGANTLQLAGNGLPAQFYKYETDASRRCVSSGTVSSSSSIPILANSITTLHSADISPVMRRAGGGMRPTRQFAGPVHVYSLDGRLIGRAERLAGRASAVRLVVGRDARRVLTVGR